MKYKPVFNFLFCFLIIIICIACEQSNNKTTPETDKKIEKNKHSIDSLIKVYNDTDIQERAKISIAFHLINQYKNFADDFPEHEKSPVYLYLAAGFAANPVQNYDETVKLYKKVYKKYPDHKKAPYALISAAFILENVFKNYNEARLLYREFIKIYPDHELIHDVKFAYENVGILPDELLKKIERGKLDNFNDNN